MLSLLCNYSYGLLLALEFVKYLELSKLHS